MSQSNSADHISLNHPSPNSLNNKLDRKLLAYATAASAAGASILALAQPGHAEIVYTPADQTISANQTLNLDLNNDGIEDFDIENQFFPMGVKAGHHGGAFPTNGSYSEGNLMALPRVSPNRFLMNSSHLAEAVLPGQTGGAERQVEPPVGTHGVLRCEVGPKRIRQGPVVQRENSLSGPGILHSRADSLRMGSSERESEWLRDHRSADRIRLRDDSRQAHHHGQDLGCE